jgi:hypothetical protein
MKNLNCAVMFDNGGGVSVEFDGWKHYYETCKDAARDYIEFVKLESAEDFEGDDEDVVIEYGQCPNGGYKTINHKEIEEMVINNPDYFWGINEEEFITSIENMRA